MNYDWLKEITSQHEELESPESFWRWSALAAMSAVLKDNVWIHRQIHNLYPNIWVMLHADSGLKKGPPISMAKQLVDAVGNTRVISGRSSVQGILKELGTAYTKPGGQVIKGAQAFICSSELSSSIVEDKAATKILTDLYDRQYNTGEWKSLLKMESFKLEAPTVTMLTATNEAMSEDFFTKSAIQGGYFARTFIIYENKGIRNNSLLYPLNNPPNYIKSADYLKELSKLRGPFEPIASIEKTDKFRFGKVINDRQLYFSEAGIIYEDWYSEFCELRSNPELKDATGTMNRFGDSVIKVAMLLSLAKQPKLEILPEAITEGIEFCERLIGNARKVTLGKSGMGNNAMLKSWIILEMLNREPHVITRKMLMKKVWMHYSNAEEFDSLMLSFHESGMIEMSALGNEMIYTMPENQVKELKEFMKAKSKQ